MDTASTAKVLTTIAVLQSLNKHHLSIDDKVSPYLYHDWVKGPHVDTITFHDLLTHHAGFRDETCGAPDYPSLKRQIAAGVRLNDKQHRVYSNCNFGIFRELLPFMEGKPIALGSDSDRANASANFFIDYTNAHIFQPLGFSAFCRPTPGNHILPYPIPSKPQVAGVDISDPTLRCGAGGWSLTARQFHEILVSLIEDDRLLSDTQKTVMAQEILGWDGGKGADLEAADCPRPYLCKNGGSFSSSGWLVSYIGIFKCTAPVVVLMNSHDNEGPLPEITGIVKDAYNRAKVSTPPGAPQPTCPP